MGLWTLRNQGRGVKLESDKDEREVGRKSERRDENRKGEKGDKRGHKWKNLSEKCSSSPTRDRGRNR